MCIVQFLSLNECVKKNREVFFLNIKKEEIMGCGKVILCIIFPPLAVLDKGCGSILLVSILTIAGWIPGAIAALIINNK